MKTVLIAGWNGGIGFEITRKLSSSFEKIHPILSRIYVNHRQYSLDVDRLIHAMTKDKKNTKGVLRLIFPTPSIGRLEIKDVSPDNNFKALLRDYLEDFFADE